MALIMFSGSCNANTTNGILFSLQRDIAVKSITFKSLFKISWYVILSYFIAAELILGSSEYTPSIVFPTNIASAFISAALKAAAVSVVK